MMIIITQMRSFTNLRLVLILPALFLFFPYNSLKNAYP